MVDGGGQAHAGRWPRWLVPEDTHYIVHKVAEAKVRDGAIVLSCVDENGRPYYGGPYHPSVFKSQRRPIPEHLGMWGMEAVGVGHTFAFRMFGRDLLPKRATP